MRIGVVGGGQLGRMLALAGYRLGLECRVLEASVSSPAGQVAPCVEGAYDDPAALAGFAEGLEVATYEFENVPAETARFLAERLPVYPPPLALETAQDRLLEKTLFARLGIPVPAFAPIDSAEQLREALERIGLPALLKTRRFGYDGRGQTVLRTIGDAEQTWAEMGEAPLIIEGLVPFEREVSLLAVRGREGETVFYPVVENTHRDGILRLSLAPAPELTTALQQEAEGYTRRVLEALDYVGVLAIEFFQQGGRLLANEMACRVHNSGHWSIEGAETSQFENHLRAVAGLPLGSTRPTGHSAMLNIIGNLPDTREVLRCPGAHLHLYGKAPRPRRKLGHLTAVTQTPAELRERLEALRPLVDP
ncbi:MAG: 5-(carboxyamino)imidazole ribonucleotide synthase [Candidatus Handelsmanbacteria bacterium]|nr:5-(carboxyamino)imidazole ribonucleotide synthase [Candidatus Handelsmanbacteria bacterium]